MSNYRDDAITFTFTATELVGMMGSGDAPGSRYGTLARHWQPIAAEYIGIMSEHFELIPETIDVMIGAVVNDSEDVATVLRDADSDLFESEWLDDA